MINLLRYFSLRHFAKKKLRTALSFAAVALGIAMYVSTDVANTSVVSALEESGRALAGKAEWQVMNGHGAGADAELLTALRAIPGAIAAPIVEVQTNVVEPVETSIFLLGVDMKTDAMLRLYARVDADPAADPGKALLTALVPNAVLLGRDFAARSGLSPGKTLTIDTQSGRRKLVVSGLLEEIGPAKLYSGGVGVMDVASAQALFARGRRFDRIEVAGASKAAIEAACPEAVLVPAGKPGSMVEDALARIKSLVAVSVIAVLVGVFIIYNTVSISVVERVKEIATLRALGATRSEMQRMLIAEWLVVGLVGSVAGVGFGWILAKVLVSFTAKTINALVTIVEVDRIILAPETAVIGVVLGLGATLAAAWFPARAALAHPPVTILRAYTYRMGKSYGRTAIFGIVLIVLSTALIWVLRGKPFIALSSTALFFVGLAMVLPWIVLITARWIRPLMARLGGLAGYLAADNAVKFPQRTALTAVALGGALAMMVASATLVEGFRKASENWLEQVMPFDISISSIDMRRTIYGGVPFPEEILADVEGLDCADIVYGARAAFCDYQGQDVMVLAIDLASYRAANARRGRQLWRGPLDRPEQLKRVQDGTHCLVSENFAWLHRKGAGDTVEVGTPGGKASFEVIAAVEDYSWPRGVLVLDLEPFRRIFGKRDLTYVDVVLKPGVSREDGRARIMKKLGGRYSAFLFEKDEIKRIASDTLDQTMALADVQVLIAVCIGFLGIFNTLLISVLERTREVGLLRAIGMSRSQIARSIVIEAIVIALAGGLVGVAVGVAGGWYPLRLFTLGIAGYLPPMVFAGRHIAAALVLAVVVGGFAAFVPARRAARLNVLDAIGYE